MADERVFKIVIDGLEYGYKNTVKLVDALKQLEDKAVKIAVETDKVSKATDNSTKASKEKAKALSDEEKAQKKLAETQEKAKKPITEIEKAQELANQQLKERTKTIKQQVAEENAATNSIAAMKAELAKLNTEWNNLDVDSEEFEELTKQIDNLTTKLKEAEAAKGTFTRNVGNYPEQINSVNQSFEKLGDGVHRTTETTKGMLSTFQAGVGLVVLFGDGNSKLEKTLSNVGKVATTVGLIQQANNTLIKSGTVSQIAYNLQNKVRASLDVLVTKGIITQTTAQTALNIATRAFPLLAIIGGITAIVSLLSDATNETKTYTSSIDGMNFATKEAADKHDDFIRRIRDIQIEIDVANGKITEYEASLLRISNTKIDLKDEALKKYNETVKASLTELENTYSGFWIGLQDLFTGAFSDTKTSQKALNKHNNIVKAAKEELDQDFANIDAETAKRVEVENAKKEKKEREDEDETAKRRKENAKNQSKQLQDILKERNRLELELTRQSEDSNTELILDEFEKREEQIKLRYSRQREDLQKRLDEDKNLNENARVAIQNIILNYTDLEISELKRINDERAKANEDKINKQRETWEKIRQLNSENADKEAEENRKNANRELLDLTKKLENKSITQKEFNDSLLNLTIKGLESEISIRKKYGQDTTDLEIELSEMRIKQAERERNKVTAYFEELHANMQKVVDNIMQGVTAIFDAANSVMKAQLDDANEKYEAISQKYDEVVAKREESSNRINELEEEAKNAKGGRALVLQEQINSEMIANQQLANQEKNLAKEKEKQDKEIAKKEKQQKKMKLASDIVSGVANTALGVTQALTWGFPLGPIFAAIIGAAGAIQVGVMTKQLSKLEDGGLLKGKRHSSGGMRVEGTNIEVEGGEYVVNRQSTAKNIGLIRYINNERRELKPSDINSFFAKSSKGFEPPFKRMFETGGQLPAINTSVNVDNEILIDAIRSMKIEPKVAVTDINNAQEDVVKVDNWTGL